MNILSGQWVLSRLMSSWAEIAILIKNFHCRVSLYEWLCQVEYTNLEVEFCAKLCNPGGVYPTSITCEYSSDQRLWR